VYIDFHQEFIGYIFWSSLMPKAHHPPALHESSHYQTLERDLVQKMFYQYIHGIVCLVQYVLIGKVTLTILAALNRTRAVSDPSGERSHP